MPCQKYPGICLILFLLSLFLPAPLLSAIPSRPDNIPDSIVTLSSGYVLVVDKQYQKIYAFKKNENFSKVFEAPCSTGKNPGAKQNTGDARTPNGVFFTTKILHKPGPPETYGTLAFPLDYPTLTDKRAGRNGYSIWIHGTTKPLSPLQSNGCVVLRDSDMHRLTNIIFFNKTPVIIQESINWISQNQAPAARDDLYRILALWNAYFRDGDIKSLDSLYLPGAEIKGKKREDLLQKFKSMKQLNDHFLLLPRDVSILRQENTAIIMFDQISSVGNDNSFQGAYTKLVLERTNNRWFIVDDVTAPATTTTAVSPSNKNVVSRTATPAQKEQLRNNAGTDIRTTAQKEQPKTNAVDEVSALVSKWAASWKSGDMKTFRNCYAAGFKARNMNLKDWVAHKNNVRKHSKNINVRIENLRVTVDSTTAKASFTQYYSSSILKSKSSKKLDIKKIDGEWKILRETI